MSWSGTASGDYQSVVRQLKDLQPTGDPIATEHGHIQVAKDAVLVVVDSKKQLDAVFSISLHGHSSTKDSFGVGMNVTVVQTQPEPG